MTDEILKLAKEKFDMTVDERCRVTYTTDNYGVTAFYRAAFNAGLEAAAKKCEQWVERYSNTVITNNGRWHGRMDADECAAAIRALKEKPCP